MIVTNLAPFSYRYFCSFCYKNNNPIKLFVLKMSGQKNMLDFFKTTPKRKSTQSDVLSSGNTKRSKLDSETEHTAGDNKENGYNELSNKGGETMTEPSPFQKNKETNDANKQIQSGNTNVIDDDQKISNVTDDKNKIDDDVDRTEHKSSPKKSQATLPFGVDVEKVKEEILAMTSKFPVIDPRMGPSWFKVLKNEFKKPYFEKLNNYVIAERRNHTIYPPPNKVWTWTKECSVENIKVVILGQDPYHNPNQAHGLCFSVEIGTPPPPSLVNMYKELTTDIEGFKAPQHGYLVGWARQGVLLLNACLTVRKNQPNSHKDQGWENLTTAVIKYLNDNREGIVFLLWGAYAQKKADFVNKKKHHVLKTVHPSPLSANRGWFGCKHFSKCNEYLESIGKRPIDWRKLPPK